jgi:hypothetical protein
MSTSTFIRTAVSGFIATFAMAMISFLLGGIGFPVIDIGHILTESFNHVHPSAPYHIIWGNLAYNIGGILLALFWVEFLQDIIPGNRIVQGLIFGVLISIAAGLIVSPFVSMAAGEPFGIFYTNTWFPGKLLIAGLLMHIAYGLTLVLSLKVAGVSLDRKKKPNKEAET